MSIKSPLGALGAVVVLIQAVAASALFAVGSRFFLQAVLVAVISVVTIGFSLLATWLIVYLVVVKKQPGLLFDPASISQSVHSVLYVPNGKGLSAKLDDKDNTERQHRPLASEPVGSRVMDEESGIRAIRGQLVDLERESKREIRNSRMFHAYGLAVAMLLAGLGFLFAAWEVSVVALWVLGIIYLVAAFFSTVYVKSWTKSKGADDDPPLRKESVDSPIEPPGPPMHD